MHCPAVRLPAEPVEAAVWEMLREQQQLERQHRGLEQRAAEQVQTQDALARLEASCQAVSAGLDALTF